MSWPGLVTNWSQPNPSITVLSFRILHWVSEDLEMNEVENKGKYINETTPH